MNRLALIVEREFRTRIRKRSFWLMSLLFPILLLMLGASPILLSKLSKTEQRIVVLDATGRYTKLLEDSPDCDFISGERTLREYQDEAEAEEIDGLLYISAALGSHPDAAQLFSYRQLPMGVIQQINHKLSEQATQERIAAYHIPELRTAIAESQAHIEVRTYRWGQGGKADETQGEIISIVGMVLTLLSYMFIMTYGSMVLQGVQEEKKSRILEIMITSVKPQQLMLGKILGIGLLGLVQLSIWGLLLMLGGIGLKAWLGLQISTSMGVPADTDILALLGVLTQLDYLSIALSFLLYFIGGYLFYASILAAMSATASSEEETGQMMAPVILLLVFAMYAGMAGAQDPDGSLAFWTSMIPLTSPIVMMVRLPFGVPIWQLALSLTVLYASFIGTSYLAARIYRVGILLYGKRPSLREVLRWLRYK